MKYLFLIITFLACAKDHKIIPESTSLPDCIKNVIYMNPCIQQVEVQEVEGEKHYFINTGSTNWDGVDFIVNNQCDTVCGLCGECIPPPCALKYDYLGWKVVWKK